MCRTYQAAHCSAACVLCAVALALHHPWPPASLNESRVIYSCMRAAVFIGLTMGLCAFLVDVSLEMLNNWKFGAVKSVIRSKGGFWRPYLTFFVICLTYSGKRMLSHFAYAFRQSLHDGRSWQSACN